MTRATIIIVAVAVVLLLVGGIVTLILLQGGSFQSGQVERSSDDDRDATTDAASAAIPNDSNNVPTSSAIEQDEESIEDTLDRWLKVNKTKTFPAETRVWDELDTINLSGKSFSRNELQAPEPCENFGFSMDACEDCLCVTASGIAFIYDSDLKIAQVLRSDEEHFGIQCIFSNDGNILLVKSSQSIFVYAKGGPQYAQSHQLNFQPKHRVLCVFDDTIWISNQLEGQLILLEKNTENEWVTHATYDIMAMDATYEPSTGHMWVASAEGLKHWSRDSNGQWIKNADWLENMPLTTVHPFVPAEGHAAGMKLVVLGEAQNDSVTLCSSMNPHQRIDRMEVPGGAKESPNVFFGDKLLWWEECDALVVSAPLDSRQDGHVYLYEISHDIRMIPSVMLRSRVREGAQFSSDVCLLSGRLFVSGENHVVVYGLD